MRPQLGWFMFFRRIGVRLGLIRNPLFSKGEFMQYQQEAAVSRKVLLFGGRLPRATSNKLVLYDARFIDLDTLIDMAASGTDETTLTQFVRDKKLVKFIVPARPLQSVFDVGYKELPRELQEEITHIDEGIAEVVAKDETFKPIVLLKMING